MCVPTQGGRRTCRERPDGEKEGEGHDKSERAGGERETDGQSLKGNSSETKKREARHSGSGGQTTQEADGREDHMSPGI